MGPKTSLKALIFHPWARSVPHSISSISGVTRTKEFSADVRPPPVTLALVNDYEVVVQGLAKMLEPFDGRVQIVELSASAPSRAPADIALYDTFATDLAFGPDVKAQHLVLYTVHTSRNS